MTVLIFPGWIVTYPVFLFVCAKYSPVLCTMYLGNDVWGCLCGGIVAMWLATRLWPFSCLDLLLYLCNSGTLHLLPSYGCVSCDRTSVSSGMMWGSVWGSWLLARPWVIMMFIFLFTIWHGTDYGGTIVLDCCVLPLCCGGSGICYNLIRCIGGGVMVLVAWECWRWQIIALVTLFVFLQVAGWGWVIEVLYQFICHVCYIIFGGKAWELILHWEELRCVRDLFWCCLGYVQCKTLIM